MTKVRVARFTINFYTTHPVRKVIFLDTLSAMESKKLGHPEFESYFVSESNNTSLHTTHIYVPFLFSFKSSPEKGGSVPQF
jgi:hypothetical protein